MKTRTQFTAEEWRLICNALHRSQVEAQLNGRDPLFTDQPAPVFTRPSLRIETRWKGDLIAVAAGVTAAVTLILILALL